MDLETECSEIEIEIWAQALKKTFGLIDHYYYVMTAKDGTKLEYHPGKYPKGQILPNGTTRGGHLVATKLVCQECYNWIVSTFQNEDDARIFQFYPFINCESLTMGLSLQSLFFLAIPFTVVLIVARKIILAIFFAVLSLFCMLLISKYNFSRTQHLQCDHIITCRSQPPERK